MHRGLAEDDAGEASLLVAERRARCGLGVGSNAGMLDLGRLSGESV